MAVASLADAQAAKVRPHRKAGKWGQIQLKDLMGQARLALV